MPRSSALRIYVRPETGGARRRRGSETRFRLQVSKHKIISRPRQKQVKTATHRDTDASRRTRQKSQTQVTGKADLAPIIPGRPAASTCTAQSRSEVGAERTPAPRAQSRSEVRAESTHSHPSQKSRQLTGTGNTMAVRRYSRTAVCATEISRHLAVTKSGALLLCLRRPTASHCPG